VRIFGAVERSGFPVPGEVSYLYGRSRWDDVSVSPAWPDRVMVRGVRDMDVVYQYRVLEGWEGDIPVTLTYLVARRSYRETDLMFREYGYGKGQFRQWLA